MSVVAHRYAQALFSLSQESTSLKEIESEARQVLSWISNNADFNAFISNQFLKAKATQPALHALSEKAVFSRTFSSFLLVVAEKSRLSLLQSILEAFLRLVDKKSGLMRGSVTTAQRAWWPRPHLGPAGAAVAVPYQLLHKQRNSGPAADLPQEWSPCQVHRAATQREGGSYSL